MPNSNMYNGGVHWSKSLMTMPESHFIGKNIWILKPTGLNRGKGIHVVDSVKEIKRLIKQHCAENSKVEKWTHLYSQGHSHNNGPTKTGLLSRKPPYGRDNHELGIGQFAGGMMSYGANGNSNFGVSKHIQTQNFVLQKYIERPMLVKDRKFDIRVWALVN